MILCIWISRHSYLRMIISYRFIHEIIISIRICCLTLFHFIYTYLISRCIPRSFISSTCKYSHTSFNCCRCRRSLKSCNRNCLCLYSIIIKEVPFCTIIYIYFFRSGGLYIFIYNYQCPSSPLS